MSDDDSLRLGTRAVHAGERQPAPRRPAAVPVYQTAPFLFDSVDELERAFGSGELAGLYSRYGNPTVRAVEEKLAALEGAEDAVAFASGMAALAGALAAVLRSGDLLVAARELYGGSHALLGFLAERHPEVEVARPRLADVAAAVAAAPRPPRAALVETPSNPGLACCDLACARGCLPRPRHDADRRQHLRHAGAADAAAARRRPRRAQRDQVPRRPQRRHRRHRRRRRRADRRVPSGRDGGRRLPRPARRFPRRSRHEDAGAARRAAVVHRGAARRDARRHPAVAAVRYPGLDEVARRQMRGGGGILSFELGGGAEAVRRVVSRLRIWQLIPSLGGVESGVGVPALTSHRQLSPAERAELGIADGLVRLSVGIEDPEDLEADLSQALAGA
jgi:methionine-gamma-lyase